MNFLASLSRQINTLANHPKAAWILFGLSFFEGFIFPLPPELLLVPMVLAQRGHAFWFATLSLLGSLCGAGVGYLLGHLAFAQISPMLRWLGWYAAIDSQVVSLQQIVSQSQWRAFGFLVCAGFTPIPLKFFTWASGIVGIPVGAFILSMLIGRAKRVYVLTAASLWGGAHARTLLVRWRKSVGWLSAVLVVAWSVWLIWQTCSR